VGGNASVTGAVQAREFSLGANTLAITGALTTNAGGTIRTTLLSDAVFGKIVVGTSNINAGGVTVIPTVTGVLTNGTNFKIVDAPAGTIGAVVSVLNNNPRYTFAGVPTTTGDVNIRLTGVTPLAALVTAPGAAAVAPVLEVIAPTGSDLLTVQDAIAVLPSGGAINSALTQLAPGAAMLGAARVVGQTASHFDDLWMTRLDEVQDLCCDTTCEPKGSAVPANSLKCKTAEKKSNWWGRGFGSFGSQGEVDNVSGYKTEAFGLMLAYDIPLSQETRIGLGAGYANTNIDGTDSNDQTKVDSYQLTGYINHAPGPWFIKGAVTVGMDRYDGSRSIVFPGVNRTANADYKGHQYSGIVTVGRHFFIDQTTITPLASIRASRIHLDGYTESGAGDINLRVNSQDYNLAQSSLGVKAERAISSGSGNFYPEVHVKWLHDLSSTTTELNAAFTGGGAEFTTHGVKQSRDLFNVGAGVSFLSCNCGQNSWTVKGLYDYKWNQSSYSEHQVSIVASLKF
ncbi:MAG TPA: autotransporter outer membrane beta-barrel domain-containing protein, partial [Azonexus sp.]|nr:autotransporter outer membrane beta-barrel domain-containing protein [Azonexus sp.]